MQSDPATGQASSDSTLVGGTVSKNLPYVLVSIDLTEVFSKIP